MENVLDNKSFDVTSPEADRNETETSPPGLDKIGSENPVSNNFSKQHFDSSVEDSGQFIGNIFTGRRFVSGESWKKITTIQARIVSYDKEIVYVDCLVDLKNRVFEHRGFPIFFFEHLNEIIEKKPVLIKTKINKGSSRIDVFPGEGIVKTELFDTNDKWEELRDSGLDEKLF